jgi:hypothetical protein
LPAVVAAKVERFPIAFSVECGGFVHDHSADGVFGHRFRFLHGHVSFLVNLFTSQQRRALNYFLDSLLITTTSRTTTTTPITVQIHIPPPAHPPIHPLVWFIMFYCFLFVVRCCRPADSVFEKSITPRSHPSKEVTSSFRFRQAPILVTAKKAARNIVGPLARRFPAVQIWFRRE